MPPQQYVLLERNLMGDLIDQHGNRYNEAFQRIDYLGRVIPEPEEEPITSSLGNGGAGAFQPQTLADYNRPDLFYHRRAEIQAEMDRLNDEPPEQSYEFQSRGPTCGWNDALLQVHEAPDHQYDMLEMKLQQAIDNQRRMIEMLNSERRPWEVSETALGITEETSQPSSVSTSVDAVLCVDRREPSQPDFDVLTSLDASEPPPVPPEHVPEPPDPDPDPEPSDPDPKPPDQHETELAEVLPKEAATPGSCHKRKFPDTTLQPPHKWIRGHTGAVAVISIAADLIDPGDTFAVYSNGPRPPPPEQWYVLFELPYSLAGRCSYPPRRSHPVAAYLLDPGDPYAVYHLGPRPP